MPDSDSPTALRRCAACSYPLRGLLSPRCPECGRPFDPKDDSQHNAALVSVRFARNVPVLIAAAALLPVQLLCLWFAWVTLGHRYTQELGGRVILGGLAVCACSALGRRWLTMIILIVAAAATIPYPLIMRVKLALIEIEARAVIEYVYRHREQAGTDPADLTGFRFREPWLANHFRYVPGFSLQWWCAHPHTFHFYDTTEGHSRSIP